MADRQFTNPDVGKEVRIEQSGTEVHLIFCAGNRYKADKLFENLLGQLKSGALNLTLMGKPTSIKET